MRKAEWIDCATEVTTREELTRLLTVEQLSQRIGLSVGTILDLLTREEIHNESNPRGEICRPAYRHFSAPLWSENQAWLYQKRMKAMNARYAETSDLAPYSPEEARQNGLVALSIMAARWGVHPASVRRWQRTSAGFPRPVGKLTQPCGVGRPDYLYRWSEASAWHRNRR